MSNFTTKICLAGKKYRAPWKIKISIILKSSIEHRFKKLLIQKFKKKSNLSQTFSTFLALFTMNSIIRVQYNLNNFFVLKKLKN